LVCSIHLNEMFMFISVVMVLRFVHYMSQTLHHMTDEPLGH
jgi:hypothetical protein